MRVASPAKRHTPSLRCPTRLVVFVLLLCMSAYSTAAVRQYVVRNDGNLPEVLLIDLDGDGIRLSSPTEGVEHVYGRGQRTRTAWTLKETADSFVVIDQNKDGRISFPSEFPGGILGPPNGFDYLRRVGMGLGPDRMRLEGSDELFRRLLVWTDSDHNGTSAESELQSLGYAGFSGIDLKGAVLLQPARLLSGGSMVTASGMAARRSGEAAAQLMTVRLAVEGTATP